MTQTSGLKTGATLFAFTNEFASRQYDFESLLREIAKRNLGPGIEVVGFQSIRGFPEVADSFAEWFKGITVELGLEPISLGINSDRYLKPGQPIPDDQLVEYHKRQMRSAAKLGFPIVRYQYSTPPALLRELAPFAEDNELKMGLEIHAPCHAEHPVVLAYREIYEELDTPALGWIPDFGGTASRIPASMLAAARAKGVPESLIALMLEFWPQEAPPPARVKRLHDAAIKDGHSPEHIQTVTLPFFMVAKNEPKSWAALVDRTIHIHGKFYGMTDDGHEEAIDYDTILPIFRDGGFSGTIVAEWEGHAYSTADAFDQVERFQAMCRRILSA